MNTLPDDLLCSQEHMCASCSRDLDNWGEISDPDAVPYIDFCPKARRVTGILCGKCYSVVNLFNRSVETMNRAMAYMKGEL